MADKLSCYDMKKGEIYICESCGLELQVLEECDQSCKIGEACCEDPSFQCCGKPLALKSKMACYKV